MWFVTRSGLLLGRKWAALAVALLVALLACSVMMAVSIWFDLAWLRPYVQLAAVVAWFGTIAVVSPEPEKPRLDGPIGPASRAFDAYKRRPSGWVLAEHDRW